MEQAKKQAVVEYPNECCGVVLISVAKPKRRILLPCRNVQNLLHATDPRTHRRDARTAFYIDPRDLAKIAIRMERGYEVGTIYHSHVETGANFSGTDKAQALVDGSPAYPEAFYVVMSVRRHQVRDIQAYAWDSKQRDFLCVTPHKTIGEEPRR
jgi:proteasome lid subunit RPN8/RPN11